MTKPPSFRGWGYVAAIAGVVLATIVRRAFDPRLGTNYPFATYMVAVLFTTWAFGLGPAVLSLLVGGAAAVYFFTPATGLGQFPSAVSVAGLFLYILIGLVAIAISEAQRRIQRRLESEIVQRRWAEKALRASEEHYRHAVELNPQIPWTADAAGRIDDFSGRWLELTGLTREEALDGAWPRVPHPDDLPGMVERWSRSVETGEPYDVEHRIRLADGEFRWMRSRAFARLDETGRVVLWYGTTEDIHDRKRVEEELARSRKLFERIAGTTPDIVYVHDLSEGRDLYVNEGVVRVLGHAPERIAELGTAPISRLVHPDDAPLAEAALARVRGLDDSDVHEHDLRLRHASGEYRWLRFREAVFERSEDGRAVKVIGTARDVTEQKRQREALSASEARFRELAEAMPQIVYVTNAAGRIVFVNRRWRSYTGKTEAQTEDLFGLVHPADADGLIRRWTEAMTDGSPLQAEFRLRRASDGEYRWFLTRSVPVRDRDGRLAGWYGTSTDIHDQKRAEEALRDDDRRKDEFLAMLAHELRNPLAPIRNAVSVMAMAEADREALRWGREVIDRQARHLSSLVDDLLDVSRITQGKISLTKAPLAVSAFVHSAIESSRPLIEARGHALQVELSDEPLRVNGDLTRLSQVVLNLLNNAAKYTPEKGHLKLSVTRNDDRCRIAVRDDGEGILPEMLPTVFDLFTQANRSLDRSQGGLGVGLTLVKRLVEMHGGSVEARSDGPGAGSEFVVSLPLLKEEQVPARISSPTADGKIDGPPPRRVLIVDDNTDSRLTLKRLLISLGHTVEAAPDGFVAIQTASRFAPDLVLLDIGLPGMDGYEVARRLRKEPALAGVRLVALTGYGGEDDRRKSRMAGFDDHLVKPVEFDSLLHVLE